MLAAHVALQTADSAVTSLTPRRMTDSRGKALLNLGSDLTLRGQYVNFFGSVRFGRILEDLDTFAGVKLTFYAATQNNVNGIYRIQNYSRYFTYGWCFLSLAKLWS